MSLISPYPISFYFISHPIPLHPTRYHLSCSEQRIRSSAQTTAAPQSPSTPSVPLSRRHTLRQRWVRSQSNNIYLFFLLFLIFQCFFFTSSFFLFFFFLLLLFLHLFLHLLFLHPYLYLLLVLPCLAPESNTSDSLPPPPLPYRLLPSSHLGTLYGVAHSTMAIGAGGGIVGCEGVTLLPPGSRWLTLALQCLQVDTRDIDQDFDEDHLLSGRNKS